jgi:hypothetical protein
LDGERFLEGIIFDDILQIQTEYYKELQRRSTVFSWATKLSNFMWEMIHTLWMERNEQLHKTERIHELHGKQQLLQERLLRKSIQDQIAWFYAVRRSREMTGCPQLILDEFTTNIHLCKWVGLPIE